MTASEYLEKCHSTYYVNVWVHPHGKDRCLSDFDKRVDAIEQVAHGVNGFMGTCYQYQYTLHVTLGGVEHLDLSDDAQELQREAYAERKHVDIERAMVRR